MPAGCTQGLASWGQGALGWVLSVPPLHRGDMEMGDPGHRHPARTLLRATQGLLLAPLRPKQLLHPPGVGQRQRGDRDLTAGVDDSAVTAGRCGAPHCSHA